MNKSSKAPRRRGRNKGDGGGNGVTSTSGGGNGMSNFHAPLIQWTDDKNSWWEYGSDIPGRNDSISSVKTKRSIQTPPLALVHKYRFIADSIYANELRLFKQSQSKHSSSDEYWVENTMKKGTLKDRIAAMSVTLSTDPIHKFYALDGLLGMVGCSNSHGSGVGKTNSRVAQLTAEALEDLFTNTLLPPTRKLLSLAQRPLFQYDDKDGINQDWDESERKKKNKIKSSSNGQKTLSPRILLLWRFEEMIKEKYDQYLRQYMAQTLQDGAELHKIATLRSAGNLLSSVPEGEITLLSMMVNKLGDPEKKTAAAAGHQLRIVLQQHSNMQTVVAREVQQLSHRPHLAPKALYNCIVFLNQIQLKRPTEATTFSLPASLIKTYFQLFEVAVQQQSKKRKQESSNKSSLNDCGGTMKSRLLSALLTGVNRAHPYLPEKDRDMEEHVDALYHIVHTSPPGAGTQALMLLFHLAVGSQLDNGNNDNKQSEREDGTNKDDTVSVEKDRQKDRFYRALYATLLKRNMISNGKHLTMYFNVLYKAMKYDTDINRVHAFAKRLLNALFHAPSPSIAASMYLVQEICTMHEGLRQSLEDIPDPETNSFLVLDDTKREPKAGIVSFKTINNSNKQLESNNRDDCFHQARGNPPCWEISLLAHHFHPSVQKFVNDIGAIDYAGDPLSDFGLAPFLDKFAYRNPKSREKLIQQHRQAGNGSGSRRTGKLQSRLQLPMNDPSFIDRTDVNEQDAFFHRFFVERARRDDLKGIKRNSSDTMVNDESSDDDLVRDEGEEQAVDAAEQAGGLDSGVKLFEEFEAAWESDDEEEVFVDSLAMHLMEDAAGGPVDIDDDPDDMDDWGDYHTNEPDGKEKIKINSTSAANRMKSVELNISKQYKDSGEDDFMETDNYMNDDSDIEPNIDEEEIMNGFGVNSFGNDEKINNFDTDDLNDLDIFLEDVDSESENEKEDISPVNKNKNMKSKNNELVFADADEYEEMIEKSFTELKRAVTTTKNGGELSSNEKSSKKRKKKRKIR